MMSSIQEQKSINKPPIIGINGMRIPDDEQEIYQVDKVNIHYIRAIQKSGGIPISLPVLEEFNEDTIKSQIEIIDGLLIEGGLDICPIFYGEDPKPELDKVDYKTDKFLFELIRQAVNRKIPILGICKGMQFINVLFGGTLYQDLKYIGLDSNSHRQLSSNINDYCKHTINIEKDSFLSKMFPDKELLNVNSYHHQAIKDLAKGIIVDAKSPDGIIEAIHLNNENEWIFGVQWHPERQIRINDELMPIFNTFIDQAKTFKNNHA